MEVTHLGKKYKLTLNAFNKVNKFKEEAVLEVGSEDAMVFVVNYLNYYADIEEIPAPEHPLSDDIKILFDLEQHIFGSLLNKDNIVEKIAFVNDIANIAEYLEMKILMKKCCAILAYYFQNII